MALSVFFKEDILNALRAMFVASEGSASLALDLLQDQDLQDAMQELNIQSEPLTDQDQAALGSSATAASPPPAPASETSYLDELEKLGELRDKGIITDEEFEAKKKELLGL